MKKYGRTMPRRITSTGRRRIKKLKRINQLIQDIQRNGYMNGIGKPEPLSGDLQGEYSRRINEKDRLVYHMENGRLYIAPCRGHYGDILHNAEYCLMRSCD